MLGNLILNCNKVLLCRNIQGSAEIALKLDSVIQSLPLGKKEQYFSEEPSETRTKPPINT